MGNLVIQYTTDPHKVEDEPEEFSNAKLEEANYASNLFRHTEMLE